MATLTASGPILLQRGEKKLIYDGLDIKSTNGHAVKIESGLDDWITFQNGSITGVGGDAINTGGYIRLRLVNMKIKTDYGPNGGMLGRAFNLYRIRELIIINCEWNFSTGGLLDQTDETTLAGDIKIINCKASNSTKVLKDGSLGQHCQFIQFSGVNTLSDTRQGYKSFLLDTFQGINPYGLQIEDGISFTNCIGTKERPLVCKRLFVRGIHAAPQFTGDNFTGSGLTIENGSEWVTITELQAVDCMNAGYNIAGGKNNSITISRNITAALQGNKSKYYWAGASMYLSDGTLPEDFKTNVIANNVHGYNSNRQLGHFFPVAGRHDICNIMYVDTGKVNDNWMDKKANTYLPGNITAETEEAEYTAWKQTLAARGVYVGAVPDVAEVNLLEGAVTGENTVSVLNKSGVAVGYKSLTYTVVDKTVATITGSGLKFTVKALKAGTTIGTVAVTSLKGVLITKNFTIVVTAKEVPVEADTEAFEIKITWG